LLWCGNIKGTWNELVSGVREPVEVGRVFGSFLTASIGVSVGRLPQEVLLEEFYRSECSETVQVGRVFEEFLTVFNCSVLTFGVQ
jgi:hypothetical protein